MATGNYLQDLHERGWDGDFSFSFINNDYAGDNYLELANLYRNELKDGL